LRHGVYNQFTAAAPTRLKCRVTSAAQVWIGYQTL